MALSPHDKVVMGLANGGIQAAGEFLGKALATVESAGFLVALTGDGEFVSAVIVDPNTPGVGAGVIAWRISDVRDAIGE